MGENKELQKKLEAEDKKKLKDLFAKLDKDGDGSLTAAEILKHLGGAKDGEEPPTEDQKKAATDMADILTEKGVAALLKFARDDSEHKMTVVEFELWFVVNVIVPKTEAEAEAKEKAEAAKKEEDEAAKVAAAAAAVSTGGA